jgi:hypothetical protein
MADNATKHSNRSSMCYARAGSPVHQQVDRSRSYASVIHPAASVTISLPSSTIVSAITWCRTCAGSLAIPFSAPFR